MAKGKKRSGRWKKILYSFLGIIILCLILTGYNFYRLFEAPNINIPSDEKESFIYVPTGITFPEFVNLLVQQHSIKNSETFEWVAQRMKLDQDLKPGRYKIYKGMNNWSLVRLLKSGKQTPVKLVLNKVRTKDQLVTFISSKLEVDSNVFRESLNDEVYLRKLGFTPQTAIALFVPNTYEFYWNTNADKFISKMKEEYDKFWTADKTAKAKARNLTPMEATTLASIVEEETNVNTDKPLIASVYINRLKKGMPLQADPTLKFALNNFGLRRLTSAHTEYDSPYNTYMYKGLPPGPICTPSLSSVSAVLNAPETQYIYFCADPDKLGYSVFATNYIEHQKNAIRYQHYLNTRGIK